MEMNPVNTRAGGTKSHQLFLLLKDDIISGRLSPGSKLPGELKLAEEHQVSRVTVRRAMEALTEEGLVIRKPGIGTLVNECSLGSTVMTASVDNLLPNMVKLGENSRIKLLEFSYRVPSAKIQEHLGLQPGERTQHSIRVRLAGDKPFSHLTTHVPERIALSYNENDLATTPLYALLERSGVEIDHATQIISATLATKEIAAALDVAVGSPLISLNRVVYDRNGQGVEHLEALYRPDRYRLQIDLNRAGSHTERYWQPLDSSKG